jgi:hypothetical protein
LIAVTPSLFKHPRRLRKPRRPLLSSLFFIEVE